MLYTPHKAPAGFDWLVRMDEWRVGAYDLRLSVITAGEQRVEVAFARMTPHVWRMRMVIPGAQPEPPTGILTMPDKPESLAITEDDSGLCADGGSLLLKIDKDPFCVRFLDADGRDVLRENPGDIDGLGR